MVGPNGATQYGEQDTLPPVSCPAPFLCEGLESLITDVGVMRSQLERIEANQVEMQAELKLALHEIRTCNRFVSELLSKSWPDK